MALQIAEITEDRDESVPDSIKKTGLNTKKALRQRKEFPETWLWTEETIRFVCDMK